MKKSLVSFRFKTDLEDGVWYDFVIVDEFSWRMIFVPQKRAMIALKAWSPVIGAGRVFDLVLPYYQFLSNALAVPRRHRGVPAMVRLRRVENRLEFKDWKVIKDD